MLLLLLVCIMALGETQQLPPITEGGTGDLNREFKAPVGPLTTITERRTPLQVVQQLRSMFKLKATTALKYFAELSLKSKTFLKGIMSFGLEPSLPTVVNSKFDLTPQEVEKVTQKYSSDPAKLADALEVEKLQKIKESLLKSEGRLAKLANQPIKRAALKLPADIVEQKTAVKKYIVEVLQNCNKLDTRLMDMQTNAERYKEMTSALSEVKEGKAALETALVEENKRLTSENKAAKELKPTGTIDQRIESLMTENKRLESIKKFRNTPLTAKQNPGGEQAKQDSIKNRAAIAENKNIENLQKKAAEYLKFEQKLNSLLGLEAPKPLAFEGDIKAQNEKITNYIDGFDQKISDIKTANKEKIEKLSIEKRIAIQQVIVDFKVFDKAMTFVVNKEFKALESLYEKQYTELKSYDTKLRESLKAERTPEFKPQHAEYVDRIQEYKKQISMLKAEIPAHEAQMKKQGKPLPSRAPSHLTATASSGGRTLSNQGASFGSNFNLPETRSTTRPGPEMRTGRSTLTRGIDATVRSGGTTSRGYTPGEPRPLEYKPEARGRVRARK